MLLGREQVSADPVGLRRTDDRPRPLVDVRPRHQTLGSSGIGGDVHLRGGEVCGEERRKERHYGDRS
jgi:hypothetical protein